MMVGFRTPEGIEAGSDVCEIDIDKGAQITPESPLPKVTLARGSIAVDVAPGQLDSAIIVAGPSQNSSDNPTFHAIDCDWNGVGISTYNGAAEVIGNRVLESAVTTLLISEESDAYSRSTLRPFQGADRTVAPLMIFLRLVTLAKRLFGLGALSAPLLASCSPELENQSRADTSQDRSLPPLQTSEASSDRDDIEREAASRSQEEAMDNHSKRLSKADLERTVVGARFSPQERNSLASTLIFHESNQVLYSYYSSGPIYSGKYYRVEDDLICVYDDQGFLHRFECISFFFWDQGLFRLDFKSRVSNNIGVLYLRQPNDGEVEK